MTSGPLEAPKLFSEGQSYSCEDVEAQQALFTLPTFEVMFLKASLGKTARFATRWCSLNTDGLISTVMNLRGGVLGGS